VILLLNKDNMIIFIHAFISIHESIRYNSRHTNYINLIGVHFCVATMPLIFVRKTEVVKHLIDAILIKLQPQYKVIPKQTNRFSRQK
jgi:hypothetical protein